MNKNDINVRMNEIMNIALAIKLYAEIEDVNLLKITVDEFIRKFSESEKG